METNQQEEKHGVPLSLIEEIEKKDKDSVEYCLLQFHIAADNLWSAYARENNYRADVIMITMQTILPALR